MAPIAEAATSLVDGSRYRWIAAAIRLRAGRLVEPARYHALKAASYAGVRGNGYSYLEAANSLQGVKLMKNLILPEPNAKLSDDLASELARKGLSRTELLSGAHLLAARKLRSSSE